MKAEQGCVSSKQPLVCCLRQSAAPRWRLHSSCRGRGPMVASMLHSTYLKHVFLYRNCTTVLTLFLMWEKMDPYHKQWAEQCGQWFNIKGVEQSPNRRNLSCDKYWKPHWYIIPNVTELGQEPWKRHLSLPALSPYSMLLTIWNIRVALYTMMRVYTASHLGLVLS